MFLKLNNRLCVCAEFVSGCGMAVDVGTDHALLPVYLIDSGKCSEVIACDINEKPLEFARKTVLSSGFSDKIKLVLSDGLERIASNGVTDVIIAGMGGELISQIIARADWLKNDVHLILQPMTKAEILRKWLCDNSFEILKEQAVSDCGIVYSVIQAKYTNDNISYDDYYLYTGKVSANSIEGQKYMLVQAQRLKKIAQGLMLSDRDKNEADRYLSLYERIRTEANFYDKSRTDL